MLHPGFDDEEVDRCWRFFAETNLILLVTFIITLLFVCSFHIHIGVVVRFLCE